MLTVVEVAAERGFAQSNVHTMDREMINSSLWGDGDSGADSEGWF